MKKLIILIGFLLNTFLLLAQDNLISAPLNPEFLNYLNQKKGVTNSFITDDGHGLGLIPSPAEANFDTYKYTGKQKGFPSTYDLRTMNLLTSVKDQGQCGSCWTFATMGSVESQWKKLGLGNFDLSEDNLNNCHRFDWKPCEGGNYMLSASYLNRRSGPVSENDDPYSGLLGAGTCPTGLTPMVYVTEMRMVPQNANAIKQALTDHGALYTNMRWEGTSYDSKNKTYYYAGTSGTNHAVLLVGWDDTKVTAGGTGAWIIRNSWSTSWGDNGFFYISYKDTKFNSGVAYFPTRIDYDGNSTVYSYDDFGWVTSYGYGTNTAFGLVKYIASANQKISKIGTWINTANSIVDIEVYDNFDGTNLSGLLGSLYYQACDLPGYYTFDLASSINISKDNDFYIKIKYSTPNNNYPIPVESKQTGYSGAATIESGKCWISSSGTSWTALGLGITNKEYDICIKAFALASAVVTTPVAATNSVTNLTPSSVTLNGTINANNSSTTVTFDYGFTLGYGSSFTATPGTVSGTSNTSVIANLTGLTSNSTYHYRIKAVNTGGTATGNDLTFTTVSSAIIPTATTYAATSVSATSATFNGKMNANNTNSTVIFQYGTTTIYTDSITSVQSPVSGTKDTLVYAIAGGLSPATLYHFRLKVKSSTGHVTGADRTFTTSSAKTIPFTENFDGADIPVGWYQQKEGTGVTDGWSISTTNMAGGNYNEVVAGWQQANPGTTRLVTPALNTTGKTALILSFKHFFDDYGPGTTLKIQSSTDGKNWTDEEWFHNSIDNAHSLGPETVSALIKYNLNSATTQVAFTITGNLYQFNWWYIDNVSITLPTVPTATALAPINITGTGAMLKGSVNPKAATTTVTFDYGLNTSYGSTVSVTGSFTGVTDYPVQASISGLAQKTTYHYRVKAVNSVGTTNSGNLSFVTNGPNAPAINVSAASGIGQSTVTLNGSVNANTLSTTISFEFGTISGDYVNWSSIPLSPNVTGSALTNVSLALSGLIPGNNYYFRLKGVNTDGTVYSNDLTFSTAGTTCDGINYLALRAETVSDQYIDLSTSGNLIVPANSDDANSAPIDIGFTFNYACQSFTQFILNTNGFIKLGNIPPSKATLFFDSGNNYSGGIFNSTNAADNYIISPFNHDLEAGAAPGATYRIYTTGITPNRVSIIQFRNLRDKATNVLRQYDMIDFQIKLYETSNKIEFVYSNWVTSTNSSAFATAAVGLKGYGTTTNQFLTLTKASTDFWATVNFLQDNYKDAAFNFGNPPERPTPDWGRIYRFVQVQPNDLCVNQVYALSKMAGQNSSPDVVSANITNLGSNTATNVTVSLNITGVNPATRNTIISSLAPKASINVSFPSYSTSVAGFDTLKVSVPNDDFQTDNIKKIPQQTYTDIFGYQGPSLDLANEAWGFENGAGMMLAKFRLTGTKSLAEVRAYIADFPDNAGNKVFAVVVDTIGNIIAQSDTITLQAGDFNKMKIFTIKNAPTFTNNSFFAGIAQVSNATTGFFPLGVMYQKPGWKNIFYDAAISGGTMYPVTSDIRYLIDVRVAAPTLAPVLITFNPLNVTQTSALFTGSVNAQNSYVDVFFEYGRTAFLETISANPVRVSGNVNTLVTASATDLTANGNFKYRIKAISPVGTTYGNEILFNSLGTPPLLTTDNASNVSSTTATSGGDVTSDGGASVTSRGVCWSKTSSPTIAGNSLAAGTGAGKFTCALTGLSGNTKYYLRAFAINTYGTSYGPEVNFTTFNVGIADIKDDNFAIFPNPNKGTFTIQFKNEISDLVTVKLINAIGSVIFEKKNVTINNSFSSMDISLNLPAGIYSLQIKGKKIDEIKKLLIQK